MKRSRSDARENKVYQQWALERKALEKRISRALVDHDSDQLARAFYELYETARTMTTKTRRLRFYPYRSFASYCRGRWHLDPEKVGKLINPFLNPVITQLERERKVRVDAF